MSRFVSCRGPIYRAPSRHVRSTSARLLSGSMFLNLAIKGKSHLYLRQFGNRRVIVSCIPDDIEAYQYANQLVNILKAANWEAQGPQITKIFGDVRSPGINVYVKADNGSDTVKILMDGFAKFNIPYQSRVTPSGTIPDTETVELFIGTQQGQRVNASGD